MKVASPCRWPSTRERGVVLYASEPAALKAAVGAPLALSDSLVVSNEAGQFEGLRPNRHVGLVRSTALETQGFTEFATRRFVLLNADGVLCLPCMRRHSPPAPPANYACPMWARQYEL